MRYLILSFLFLFFGNTIIAQTKSEKAVAVAVETLRTAMISGDKASLEAITADELSYGHSGGAVEGKANFIEKITSGKSDFVTIELTDQTVKVSGKTAIVRHHLNATTNDNGKPGTVELNILLIFQKPHGKWLLLARQAVKVQR